MLEDVINESVLFQMYDTRISNLDYTHYVAMSTHTHIHARAHTHIHTCVRVRAHTLVFQTVLCAGEETRGLREIIFSLKRISHCEVSNIILIQLEAW